MQCSYCGQPGQGCVTQYYLSAQFLLALFNCLWMDLHAMLWFRTTVKWFRQWKSLLSLWIITEATSGGLHCSELLLICKKIIFYLFVAPKILPSFFVEAGIWIFIVDKTFYKYTTTLCIKNKPYLRRLQELGCCSLWSTVFNAWSLLASCWLVYDQINLQVDQLFLEATIIIFPRVLYRTAKQST